MNQPLKAPSLSPESQKAAFIPGEVITDPWLVYMGYQQNALDHHVDIKLNTKVEQIEYSKEEWQIKTSNGQGSFIARHMSPSAFLVLNIASSDHLVLNSAQEVFI